MNMLWFPHTMEYPTQCRGIIYHDMQHCGWISEVMHKEARLGREHRVWARLYEWQEQAKLRGAFRSWEGTSSWGGDGGWKGTPGDVGGLGKFYFSIWVLVAWICSVCGNVEHLWCVLFPRLLQPLVAPAFPGLWPHHFILCLSLYSLLLSLCVSLQREVVIAFRTHLNNSGWSHLKILNIYKDPFSNEGWVHKFQVSHGHFLVTERCVPVQWAERWPPKWPCPDPWNLWTQRSLEKGSLQIWLSVLKVRSSWIIQVGSKCSDKCLSERYKK